MIYISCNYLKKILLRINVATDKGSSQNESDTEETVKLELFYKVDSECMSNSWFDCPVG